MLPDDSMVVRLPDRIIHIDAVRRAVHVRASGARYDLGGSLVASHPFARVSRVRIVVLAPDEVRLSLELSTGQAVGLGHAASRDLAMLTARAVADLCRCNLDAGQGTTDVPPSRPDLEAITGPIPVPEPRWAGSLVGVVPLVGPKPQTPPAQKDALHRITRELSRPPRAALTSEAIAAPPPDEGPTAPAATGEPAEPVFGALLRESELAQALDPRELEAVFRAAGATTGEEPDQKATMVGVARVGGRLEALGEILTLAAEQLPVAGPDLAAAPAARTRGRSRAR